MSFRKRNVGLSSASKDTPAEVAELHTSTVSNAESLPGVRPSPDDGRLTTSTGSLSLDNLLAGHAGLPLGKILLIEENGTTDFAGTLLRYFAAEGVVQQQQVHVVGVGEQWGRSLPGLVGSAEAIRDKSDRRTEDRMKIAWRYERLGEFGTGVAGSRALPGEKMQNTGEDMSTRTEQAFCHTFDLTKRLTHPSISSMDFIPLIPSQHSPFSSVYQRLQAAIIGHPTPTIHRIIIPSLLNPIAYPPESAQPELLLQFLHSLRALMVNLPNRISAMISLPLSLYPRSSGLVRWLEILSDGVLELTPFPHSSEAFSSSGATSYEEPPQGMIKTHKLPVLHERGGGSDQNVGEDWAFTLSRRKFEIKPFSLPPADGDSEAQASKAENSTPKKANLEF